MLRRFLYSFFAIAALAGGAWAQSTTTITQTLNLPPIGLAPSETAQINVANLAANAGNGTAASCTGTIAFVNASGATMGTASSFTIAAGKMESVTLPYSATSASGRAEIRGVITVTMNVGTPCSLVSSLETYDTASGVTHVFFTGPSGASAVHPMPMPYPNR